MALHFKIVTPERVVYEKEILQVSVPTTTGEITILPHHIPLISTVAAGELKIVDQGGEHVIAIAGGVLEIKSDNEVTILADNAERVEEIDIARAEAAKKHAEEAMQQMKQTEDVDFAKMQVIIDRELNRIRVGKKYRKLP